MTDIVRTPAVRGVHFYMPGRHQVDFFRRSLDWLASLGYNTLFLEVGGGMRYDRHPAINDAWKRLCAAASAHPGGPRGLQTSQRFPKNSIHTELGDGDFLEKEEVRGLVEFARGLGLAVVPEVQTLSHSYYLCCAYPEIAERSDDPWPDTCCPSNPRTYEIEFDVFDEAIEVFEPTLIHIGHDELYQLGQCPRCQGRSGAELLAGEVTKVHGYLAQHGIRTALWADTLLPMAPHGQGRWVDLNVEGDQDSTWRHYIPETYPAIDQIPADVVLLEWIGQQDSSVPAYLAERGFDVVRGNFGEYYRRTVPLDWSEKSIVGAEVSTWSSVSEFGLGYNGFPFKSMLVSRMFEGDHPDDTVVAEIAARMPDVRERLGAPPQPSRQSGALQISAARGSLRLLPSSPPVSLAVGRPARSLVFEHVIETEQPRTASWRLADPTRFDPKDLVAIYTAHFAGGRAEPIEIHLGCHIGVAARPYGYGLDSTPYWADPIFDGDSVRYRYEWLSPCPDQTLESIELVYVSSAPGSVIVQDVRTVS